MTVKIYKSLLSNQVIDSLLDFFNSNTSLHYDTMGMIKIGQPWNHIQHILEPILKKYIPVDKNLGDNFYKHSFPYFTHVDSGNNKNSYNVLIPLYVSNNIEQKFVVFDQYCTDYSGATWLGDIWKPEQDFNLNKKRDFPYKDDIGNVKFADHLGSAIPIIAHQIFKAQLGNNIDRCIRALITQ